MAKRYPFSFIKNGHNIELAYNHQWLICEEMRDGERPYDQKAFDHMQNILDVLERTGTTGIAWCSGKDWAFLKDLCMWAYVYRDTCNAKEK